MLELMTLQTTAAAAPLQLGPVLIAGGRAHGRNLIELARWTGVAETDVSVLLPDAQSLARGTTAFSVLCDMPPQDAPLNPARLLRALVDARAATLVLAYPIDAPRRAEFALTMQRLRDEIDLNMIVYFERHQRPWRRILVPYLSVLDAAAFQLAMRSSAAVTLLHALERQGETDPALLRAELEQLHGCAVRAVEADDPLAAAANEARSDYDLLVIGGGQVLPGHSFTMRQQRMLLATDLSLVVVHSSR